MWEIFKKENTRKGKRGKDKKKRKDRIKARLHFLPGELDGKDLLLKQKFKKKDLIGGKKMVFYQYDASMYKTEFFPNFAGRRKSAKQSAYRGVYWNKHHHKWEVKVKFKGTSFSLGFFETEEAAARKYDVDIVRFVINRLAINFPEEVGGIKLRVQDLVEEGDESIEDAEKRLQKRVDAKVQDLAMDFGLDTPTQVRAGCKNWEKGGK